MSYLEKFNFQLYGKEASSKKLVFLHGLMGSAANWRKIINHFKQDFQILSFDQRGHGRSFQPDTGYSPEDYAKDLLKIIDELGWDKIYLVGHSMGGRNAISFTSKNKHRVKSLVIEDIGPELGDRAYKDIKGLLDLVPTPFKSKKVAKEFFNTEFESLISHKPNPRLLSQYFYTNIMETAEGLADWRFSKNAILQSLTEAHKVERWEQLEKIICPTLVIRGGNSKEFTRAVFDKMLICNNRFKGVEIEQAGHWVHFDKPKEFVEALSSFFKKGD